jgi:HPt (histidine-containing phosphotransfer) domain-containing protein
MEKKYKYIDLTYIKEIAEGNNELIVELVDIYKLQVKEYIVDFNKFLESKNWDSLGALAHKSKSSAAVMGLNALASDLKELEILAKNHSETETYLNYIKKFEEISNNAVAELDNYISTL